MDLINTERKENLKSEEAYSSTLENLVDIGEYKFNPILPMSVPYMVIPMENFEERYKEIDRVIEQNDIELFEKNGVPSDFYDNPEYMSVKNNFFTKFFEKEIDLISKAWFNYRVNMINQMKETLVDFTDGSFFTKDNKYDPDLHGFVITASWFERAYTFHQHFVHDHGPETFSCIFYHEFDSVAHEATNIVSPVKTPENLTPQFTPKVNRGDILVVPGNILHYTKPNISALPRSIIAFNLISKGTINYISNLKGEL